MERRWRTLLFGLTGAAVVGIAAYAWWIANPPEVDEVEPADAIVVFAGQPDRFRQGLTLGEAGVADSVVFSSGELPRGFDVYCGQADPFTVECEAPEQANTAGEARMFARLANERGWGRVVAVTSSYHVRRASMLLGSCVDIPVQFVGVPREGGVGTLVDRVAHEMAGLPKDWLTGRC